MTQSTGAPVPVDLLVVQFKITHRRHCDYCKCLVDLIEINVCRFPVEFFEQLSNCKHGRSCEQSRFLGVTGMPDNFGQWDVAALFSSR